MASSLRLIASNLATRSTLLPTVVSASRFLSIDHAGQRSYSTTPKDDFNDQSSARIRFLGTPAMSFEMRMTDKERNLILNIPDAGVRVELDKPGLKKKDMRACAEHNTLFINDIMLPHKTSRDIKEEVTLPKDDELKSTNIILNNLANDIITSFCDITAKRSWSYYDMFSDRSILGKGLCLLLAKRSPINAFTIHKRETAEVLEIEMRVHQHDLKLITQGLRVDATLKNKSYWKGNYSGERLDREEVKVFFNYNTFFIEGKNEKNHHIQGVYLPEGIHMKHNMIRREMIDDTFYAFLPCCGKMEELHDLIN